jgi:hypothetical protein
LNFDCQGIPYFEPSFASIERIDMTNSTHYPSSSETTAAAAAVTVHGVIHFITRAEMIAIRLSEGGNGHDGLGYDVREVEVVTYSGEKLLASTLIWRRRGVTAAAHPSRRYMNLLLDGARVNRLDPPYLSYLLSLPIYERKRLSQTIGSWVSGCLTLTLFLPLFLLIGVYRLWTNKRPPRVTILALNLARDLIALLHDSLLCPLFGSGERSEE